MTWRGIPEREKDRLLNLFLTLDKRSRESTLLLEANRLGLPYLTLIRRLQERVKKNASSANIDNEQPFWRAKTPYIQSEKAIIISDIEIPDEHKGLLLDYIPKVAKRFGIKDLIWAGDMLAADQLSRHPQIYATSSPSLEENLDTLWGYIDTYKGIFDRQILITGNHDLRIAAATNGEIWYGINRPSDERVLISRLPYLNVETPRRQLRITHPYKHYSTNGVGLGQSLLNKLPVRSDIMLAHLHLCQKGWSADGQYEIIVLPCVRDYERTQYVNMDDNKHHVWIPGITLMLDGYYHLLPLYGTNWEFWT